MAPVLTASASSVFGAVSAESNSHLEAESIQVSQYNSIKSLSLTVMWGLWAGWVLHPSVGGSHWSSNGAGGGTGKVGHCGRTSAAGTKWGQSLRGRTICKATGPEWGWTTLPIMTLIAQGICPWLELQLLQPSLLSRNTYCGNKKPHFWCWRTNNFFSWFRLFHTLARPNSPVVWVLLDLCMPVGT